MMFYKNVCVMSGLLTGAKCIGEPRVRNKSQLPLICLFGNLAVTAYISGHIVLICRNDDKRRDLTFLEHYWIVSTFLCVLDLITSPVR